MGIIDDTCAYRNGHDAGTRLIALDTTREYRPAEKNRRIASRHAGFSPFETGQVNIALPGWPYFTPSITINPVAVLEIGM